MKNEHKKLVPAKTNIWRHLARKESGSTGAALASKNTYSEQLTTKYGGH